MTDEDIREAIRAAYEHNDRARSMGSATHAYMGSLATHRLLVLLGSAGSSLESALLRASRAQLEDAYRYLAKHGYLRPQARPKDAPSTPEELCVLMEAWLNTRSSYFNKKFPFFEGEIMRVMADYDCNDEAAVAILFAEYADELMGAGNL